MPPPTLGTNQDLSDSKKAFHIIGALEKQYGKLCFLRNDQDYLTLHIGIYQERIIVKPEVGKNVIFENWQ